MPRRVNSARSSVSFIGGGHLDLANRDTGDLVAFDGDAGELFGFAVSNSFVTLNILPAGNAGGDGIQGHSQHGPDDVFSGDGLAIGPLSAFTDGGPVGQSGSVVAFSSSQFPNDLFGGALLGLVVLAQLSPQEVGVVGQGGVLVGRLDLVGAVSLVPLNYQGSLRLSLRSLSGILVEFNYNATFACDEVVVDICFIEERLECRSLVNEFKNMFFAPACSNLVALGTVTTCEYSSSFSSSKG